MAAMLKDRLARYVRDTGHAFHAAPVEVGLAVLAAVGCSYAIEAGNTAFEVWVELVVSLALAFSVAWMATLLHALNVLTEKQRWAVTLAGGVLAAVYLGWVADFDLAAERWRAFMLVSAAAGFTLSAPAFARAASDRNLVLRRVDGRFLLRTIGIALYGLALFGGLALALKSVDTLFELDLRGDIYGHVFAWIMLTLVPWVIVGGLPDYVRPLDQTSEVARVIHRLVGFLVPPLLAVYYLILYAYAIRIIVLGELPKNLVSPMVIAAGLLGALALLFFYDRTEERDTMRPLRFAPALFLPLTVMGFWALSPRIEQYGWTEFRVLRLALLITLTLLAIAGTIQIFRRRTIPLRVILLALAVTLLLCAVGPWSVLAIARRSQQSRLVQALSEAGIRQADGTFARSAGKQVDNRVYDQISSAARYLDEHFGREYLGRILPAQALSDQALGDLASHFSLRRSQPSTVDRYQSAHLGSGAPLQIAPGVSAYRIALRDAPGRQAAGISPDSVVLSIAFDRDTLAVELQLLLREMSPMRGQQPGLSAQGAVLSAMDAVGRRRGSVLVLDADGSLVNNRLTLNRFDGILMLEGEWPVGIPTVTARSRWR